MKKTLLFSAIPVLFAIASCNNEAAKPAVTENKFSLDSVKAAIAASNRLFEESLAKGDSALFVSRYTSDGCINPANLPRMCGSAAIGNFFKGAGAMGVTGIALTTEEVMGGPEIVAETGLYEMKGKDGVTLEKGKFIVLWKQENGQWKMYRDEWNSNDAPAPPPPAKK